MRSQFYWLQYIFIKSFSKNICRNFVFPCGYLILKIWRVFSQKISPWYLIFEIWTVFVQLFSLHKDIWSVDEDEGVLIGLRCHQTIQIHFRTLILNNTALLPYFFEEWTNGVFLGGCLWTGEKLANVNKSPSKVCLCSPKSIFKCRWNSHLKQHSPSSFIWRIGW